MFFFDSRCIYNDGNSTHATMHTLSITAVEFLLRSVSQEEHLAVTASEKSNLSYLTNEHI